MRYGHDFNNLLFLFLKNELKALEWIYFLSQEIRFHVTKLMKTCWRQRLKYWIFHEHISTSICT